MKKSINQLRVELAQIQQSHLQLNDFFWGDFLRSYKENGLNYPMMGAFYPSGSLLLRQTQIQLTIWVCDKIYEDWSNLNEVESDTLQICRDIFNTINHSTRWNLIGKVQSCTVTKFIERGGDCVAGHQMVFQFLLRDSESICGLPMPDYDFEQSVGAGGCAPVQIYKDGVLVATLDPGSIYDYFSDVVTIKDTDNNTLYEVTGTATQTIQDSTVTIKNTANTTIHTVTLLAEQTGSQTIADTTVSNSDDTYTVSVLAEGSLELPDITVSNSDDSYSVSSPSVKNIEIPDTPVTNGLNYNVNQPSGTQLLLPETDINVNTIEYGSVTSIEDVDIVLTDGTNPVVPTSVDVTDNTVTIQMPVTTQRKSAKLIKTGQTTSFRTGDDGDFERGRLTDFFTLVAVPVNDNGSATVNTTTNRFTSELGTQTYTNNIVIDWSTFDGSTVLGYYRIVSGSNIDWNAAIDAALAHSVGTFTTGWSLWNRRECENLLYEGVSASTYLNYAPFNITADVNIWTSTTAKLVTTTARFLGSTGNGNIGALTKTVAAARWVAVRNFNVVGATLT